MKLPSEQRRELGDLMHAALLRAAEWDQAEVRFREARILIEEWLASHVGKTRKAIEDALPVGYMTVLKEIRRIPEAGLPKEPPLDDLLGWVKPPRKP